VTGASQLAYFAAVASTGIAVATLIANGLGPILTAVGETVVFRVRPDRRTLVALPVADRARAARARWARGSDDRRPAVRDRGGDHLRDGDARRRAREPRMDITMLNAVAVVGGTLTLLPFVLVTGGGGAPDSAGG
jgi:hypothetical protein